MDILISKTDRPVSLKCDTDTLKEIVKKVIENNTSGPFTVTNLRFPLTETFRTEQLFEDYNLKYDNPILTPKDLMRINQILNELIVSGHLGINFFDKRFSGNDLELFVIDPNL